MVDIVPNGRVLFGGEELKFSTANLSILQVPHEHHVTVSCDHGFTLTGTTKLKCTKGTWSEPFPTCQPSEYQICSFFPHCAHRHHFFSNHVK